jgi:hypothetical protein
MNLKRLAAKRGKFRLTFVSFIAIFFGLSLLSTSIGTGMDIFHGVSSTVQTQAQVLSVESISAPTKNAITYTNAQVRFSTIEGQVVEAAIQDDGDTDITAVGQIISIYYSPKDPTHPRTAANVWNRSVRETILWGLLGLISCWLGYLVATKQ